MLEHVDGPTLAEELSRRGRYPPEEVARIGQQVCAGLAHAHAAGLVHRDVKPRNLLRAPDGTVKIADFGIARAEDSTQITLAGTVVGTAAYLAPEQARGDPVTPAADVYALGVVLYELLTGKPPHDADSLPELVSRQARGKVTPPSRAALGVNGPSTRSSSRASRSTRGRDRRATRSQWRCRPNQARMCLRLACRPRLRGSRGLARPERRSPPPSAPSGAAGHPCRACLWRWHSLHLSVACLTGSPRAAGGLAAPVAGPCSSAPRWPAWVWWSAWV